MWPHNANLNSATSLAWLGREQASKSIYENGIMFGEHAKMSNFGRQNSMLLSPTTPDDVFSEGNLPSRSISLKSDERFCSSHSTDNEEDQKEHLHSDVECSYPSRDDSAWNEKVSENTFKLGLPFVHRRHIDAKSVSPIPTKMTLFEHPRSSSAPKQGFLETNMNDRIQNTSFVMHNRDEVTFKEGWKEVRNDSIKDKAENEGIQHHRKKLNFGIDSILGDDVSKNKEKREDECNERKQIKFNRSLSAGKPQNLTEHEDDNRFGIRLRHSMSGKEECIRPKDDYRVDNNNNKCDEIRDIFRVARSEDGTTRKGDDTLQQSHQVAMQMLKQAHERMSSFDNKQAHPGDLSRLYYERQIQLYLYKQRLLSQLQTNGAARDQSLNLLEKVPHGLPQFPPSFLPYYMNPYFHHAYNNLQKRCSTDSSDSTDEAKERRRSTALDYRDGTDRDPEQRASLHLNGLDHKYRSHIDSSVQSGELSPIRKFPFGIGNESLPIPRISPPRAENARESDELSLLERRQKEIANRTKSNSFLDYLRPSNSSRLPFPFMSGMRHRSAEENIDSHRQNKERFASSIDRDVPIPRPVGFGPQGLGTMPWNQNALRQNRSPLDQYPLSYGSSSFQPQTIAGINTSSISAVRGIKSPSFLRSLSQRFDGWGAAHGSSRLSMGQGNRFEHHHVSNNYDARNMTVSGTGRKRRKWNRAVFSLLQRQGLEKSFETQKYVAKAERRKLAEALNLTDAQVKIWFQNRRMKWRQEIKMKDRGLVPTNNSNNLKREPFASDKDSDDDAMVIDDRDCDEKHEGNVINVE
uniref:homeobox protein AHox1-like n=1 Tax=Styela clava TaxID=7725 RepID=UPI00193AC4B3|nr:homeobox protein AHox1-like [Styela clava]